MAAAFRGRLYVVGGYLRFASPLARAFVLEEGRWRELRPMPAPRAAGGAAVVGGKLYVVGGVGPNGLARRAFVYDIARNRWASVTGPAPREHLAVTLVRGRIYAVAGRLAGIDTNLTTVESWAPGERHWRTEPRVPQARGGTGASAVGRRLIVSVGGEEPSGTIASVYAFDVARRVWERLPDLRTPRHGLGVVTLGSTVYAIAGGPRPGLFVSAANEALPFGPGSREHRP
jgi:non-specific serine/threonine protein kinase